METAKYTEMQRNFPIPDGDEDSQFYSDMDAIGRGAFNRMARISTKKSSMPMAASKKNQNNKTDNLRRD